MPVWPAESSVTKLLLLLCVVLWVCMWSCSVSMVSACMMSTCRGH